MSNIADRGSDWQGAMERGEEEAAEETAVTAAWVGELVRRLDAWSCHVLVALAAHEWETGGCYLPATPAEAHTAAWLISPHLGLLSPEWLAGANQWAYQLTPLGWAVVDVLLTGGAVAGEAGQDLEGGEMDREREAEGGGVGESAREP